MRECNQGELGWTHRSLNEIRERDRRALRYGDEAIGGDHLDRGDEPSDDRAEHDQCRRAQASGARDDGRDRKDRRAERGIELGLRIAGETGCRDRRDRGTPSSQEDVGSGRARCAATRREPRRGSPPSARRRDGLPATRRTRRARRVAPPIPAGSGSRPSQRRKQYRPTDAPPNAITSTPTQATMPGKIAKKSDVGERDRRVRRSEQGCAAPAEGVIDRQMAVGEDLSGEHPQRVVLDDVVAREQGVSGRRRDREDDERDPDQQTERDEIATPTTPEGHVGRGADSVCETPSCVHAPVGTRGSHGGDGTEGPAATAGPCRDARNSQCQFSGGLGRITPVSTGGLDLGAEVRPDTDGRVEPPLPSNPLLALAERIFVLDYSYDWGWLNAIRARRAGVVRTLASTGRRYRAVRARCDEGRWCAVARGGDGFHCFGRDLLRSDPTRLSVHVEAPRRVVLRHSAAAGDRRVPRRRLVRRSSSESSPSTAASF